MHGTAAFDLAGDILLALVELGGGAGGAGAGIVSVGRRGEGRPLAAHGGELFVGDQRDVAISAELSGVDPEGEVLEFRITKRPARGAVTLAEEGSARFTYTPYENKTGRDHFTYVAVDPAGNTSHPAVVSIRIQK